MPRTPPPELPVLSLLHALRSSDAIFVSDGRQRVVAWSDEAERVLGHPAEAVIGRLCYQVIAGTEPSGHPVCRRDCGVVTNARHGRPTAAYDVVTRTAGGDPVCLTSHIILVTSEGRKRPYMLHLVRPNVAREPNGGTLATAPVPRDAVDRSTVPPIGQPLSRRELEVLRLLAAGRNTREIATTLTVSPFTARNHIGNLQRKLGARSRVEAIVFAAHHHLI